jgi:hypothetical protein
MLHLETIEPRTLDLLAKLQNLAIFSDLRLVGGTALALQIGHRKSVDLDLFGTLTADEFEISNRLAKIGSVTILRKSENINIFLIEGIKVDIVNYPYKWLAKPLVKSNLVIADMKDIAAMKLAAITGRGTKKDFIDLFFLLKYYNLKELLDFYTQKYDDGSAFLVLKSLSYFEDAESDETPMMLKSHNWESIKEFIKITLDNFLTQ